jgi:fructokinase
VRRILVAGETILDLAPVAHGVGDVARFEAALGGSAFNAARALGALGAPVSFAGAVSADAWGARFRDALLAAGVECSALVTCDAPMPLALVSPETAAGVSFTLYLHGTAHERSGPPALLPPDASHLHVSSFHAMTAPTGDAVLALMGAARGRASMSFDPNVRPGVLPPREEALRLVEARVALCDVVKASAQDLAWLYPGREPDAVMADWAARGPRLAVLTLGPRGAIAMAGAEKIAVAAPPVEVVDTVGAGDAFTAGLLSAMAADGALGPDGASFDPAQVARWLARAVAAGSWTCARRGAQAPTLAELAV